MKRLLVIFFLTYNSGLLFAQLTLTIEGTVINDTIKGASSGVNIPRAYPTIFTYRNNSLTSVNGNGYMLQAGDENPGTSNNNLDGEIITGNKFNWNGTDPTSFTHALFTGFNINAVIKYNYLYNAPNGIQRKSAGMNDISGVIAYNILSNSKLGIAVKGINGIKIYNNTFYSEKTSAQTNRGLIDIHKNLDGGLDAASTGTKVFNNIFYTKNRIINIKIQESACLEGFESDYNVFWCEAGEPIFELEGVPKTFTQWKAMGYDTHSIVINPAFTNFTDFVPPVRLNYGKSLGTAWQSGLSVDAVWGQADPDTTNQNGIWQVGARIYGAATGIDNISGSDESAKKIKIYPNPAHDSFSVTINNPMLLPQRMNIIDLAGRIVYSGFVENGNNNIKLVNDLKPGIYVLVVGSISNKRLGQELILIY